MTTSASEPAHAGGLRVIRHDALDGAFNMAVDDALFQLAEQRQNTIPVLRLYRWQRPTLSLGRHQQVADATRGSELERLDVRVVRRPTGGRAVLHDHELTYAFVSPVRGPFSSLTSSASYLSEILGHAFGSLGLPVTSGSPSSPSSYRGPRGRLPCFAASGRYELNHHGRKLAASAQRRGRWAFLQHGSLPFHFDADGTRRLTGATGELKGVGLEQLLERRVTPQELGDALVEAFERGLGELARPSELDAAERELADSLVAGVRLEREP